MEVTAFHIHTRKCLLVSVALFRALYLVPQTFSVRLLAVILLCAARTFLPLIKLGSDCLASFKCILARLHDVSILNGFFACFDRVYRLYVAATSAT